MMFLSFDKGVTVSGRHFGDKIQKQKIFWKLDIRYQRILVQNCIKLQTGQLTLVALVEIAIVHCPPLFHVWCKRIGALKFVY